MAPLIMSVYDVGSGTFIAARTPNGKLVVIDCGRGDYSPSSRINRTGEKKNIHYLIISHPHNDHISDLPGLDAKFQVKMLRINRELTLEKVTDCNTDDDFDPGSDECLTTYYKYAEKFTDAVPEERSPQNPKWGCGCTFHCYAATDNNFSINDLSVTVFIEYGQHVIFYGADIEQKGWESLLKKKSFCERLARTTIFIASHHGNDSGYTADAFKSCSPDIIIMSTGPSDNTVVSKYEQWSRGLRVKSNGEADVRKVLTTRNDGVIKMVLNEHKDPTITVKGSDGYA